MSKPKHQREYVLSNRNTNIGSIGSRSREVTRYSTVCNSSRKRFLNSRPKQPTPLNLYHASRKSALFSLGNNKTEVFNICVQEYRELPDEEKIHWISQALEKEPAYIVSYYAYYILSSHRMIIFYFVPG